MAGPGILPHTIEDVGPTWLIHLFAICNAGAFLSLGLTHVGPRGACSRSWFHRALDRMRYYLLSIWLALHASVAAHAFGVRP